MPFPRTKTRGFKEMRVDMRARRKYLIATWTIGILLLSFVAFAVYRAIDFTDRIFERESSDSSRVTTFNLSGAQNIRRLEHLWTTPGP